MGHGAPRGTHSSPGWRTWDCVSFCLLTPETPHHPAHIKPGRTHLLQLGGDIAQAAGRGRPLAPLFPTAQGPGVGKVVGVRGQGPCGESFRRVKPRS